MITQSAWKDIIINMKNNKLITFLKMLSLTCVLIFAFTQFGLVGKHGKSGKDASGAYTMYDFAMGTSFQLELYGSDTKNIANHCMELVDEIDLQYLSRRADTSELYKLNQSLQVDNPVVISDKLYAILDKTSAVCQAGEGVFDYTILPVSRIWNIEDADSDTFVVPDDADIERALQRVGYEHVNLLRDMDTCQISTDITSMEMELGAVGKGYVLDELREYLKSQTAITGAVIHAGGSILVYGDKLDGTNWKIGIRDPKGNIDDVIGYVEYKSGANICVSTSGDYEKYIERDGVRYHHIIDAISGKPADAGLSSVTVICEDGLYSDALSTACFILGYEKSLPVLKQFGAEAIFIDHNNNVVCTEGVEKQFHLL